MPSIQKENIDVVVSVDTSGSISREELSEFISEIKGIAKSFANIKITLIVCDYEIHEVYELGRNDNFSDLKIEGGGGTSHKPVYDWVRENKPSTRILINFTDGYTEFPETEEFKTIWAITKDGIKEDGLPFGDYIRIE